MTTMGIRKAVLADSVLAAQSRSSSPSTFPIGPQASFLSKQAVILAEDQLGSLNPLRYSLINAILMSFSSYPAVVKSVYSFLYVNPARFARDAALVSEACDINRTPHARDAFYWMQRGVNFDFALPDPSRIKSVAVPTLILWG